MIKNLIKLDFYTMKPLAKIMLAFLIIPIILGIVADLGASILVTLTFVVFMLNTVFAIAEKSHFHKLYGILPMKNSQKVLSRYLFSLIIVSITAIISYIIYIALSFILYDTIDWMRGIQFLVMSIVVALFFISIQYPFYFKLDYSKATIMSILPYIICFAIGAPLLQYLMKNIEFYTQVMKVILYFQTNPINFILSGIFLSLFMISCSYFASVKIQKSEF